eukprot:13676662-Alexandrium_andersonii.AAC.1
MDRLRGGAEPPLPARPARSSATPAEGQAPRSGNCLHPGAAADLPWADGESGIPRAVPAQRAGTTGATTPSGLAAVRNACPRPAAHRRLRTEPPPSRCKRGVFSRAEYLSTSQ